MKSFTNRCTAREAFEAIRAELASIQSRLDNRMVERAREFAGESRFDVLADEERVLRHLAIALAAAGDRSAVDELEIEY